MCSRPAFLPRAVGRTMTISSQRCLDASDLLAVALALGLGELGQPARELAIAACGCASTRLFSSSVRPTVALRTSRFRVIATSAARGSLASAYLPDSTCSAVGGGSCTGASSRKDCPARAAEYMARRRVSVKSQKALSASAVAISDGWSASRAITSSSSVGGGATVRGAPGDPMPGLDPRRSKAPRSEGAPAWPGAFGWAGALGYPDRCDEAAGPWLAPRATALRTTPTSTSSAVAKVADD